MGRFSKEDFTVALVAPPHAHCMVDQLKSIAPLDDAQIERIIHS
jgi:hypothetical protein